MRRKLDMLVLSETQMESKGECLVQCYEKHLVWMMVGVEKE